MGLSTNRKVNRYLKGIERAAWSAAQAQPKRFTRVGVLLRNHLGGQGTTGHRADSRPIGRPGCTRYSPRWPMAGSSPPSRSPATRKIGIHGSSFVLPLPEETRLYDLGKVRTSKTIWSDSVDDLDLALRLLEQVPSNSRRRDEVVTRLNNAREGFAHLWPRMSWKDSTFGRSLVAQCQYVISTITTGDPARLQQEQDKAASLLAAAKRFSPRWSWSVDNEQLRSGAADASASAGLPDPHRATPAGRPAAVPGTCMVRAGACPDGSVDEASAGTCHLRRGRSR